jgi:hypothetical protein
MENKSKTNTVLLVIIIILLVLGLGYYFLNNSKLKGGEVLDNKNIINQKDTYTYTNHGFSILLPNGFTPTEEHLTTGPVISISMPVGNLGYITDSSFWETSTIPSYTYIKEQKIGESTFKVYEYMGATFYWLKQGNVGYEFGGTDKVELENLIKTFILKNNSENQDNLTCNESPDYLAISRRIIGETGSDLLIKYKMSAGQKISCNYFVEKNDFELKNNGGANYFMAFEGKFLIMDEGTAVNNRGMNIYDLSKKSKIFSDRYSSGEPIIKNNTITYWINTNEVATIENCPQLYNSGGAIVAQVSLDLSTLIRKDLGNKRCAYQE